MASHLMIIRKRQKDIEIPCNFAYENKMAQLVL